MAIHKDFADWYRSASITPSQELLDARWLGVEEAAGTLKVGELLELLRLYSIRLQSEYKATDFLDTTFRKHDSAFPNRNNTEELRVLAGAILRQAIESNGIWAVPVALGISCSSYGSRRERLPTTDHVAAAEIFLAQRSVSARDVKAPPTFKITPMTRERFNELIPPAVFAVNQTPNAHDPLFAAFNDQSSRYNQNINQLGSSLWQIIQVQREELNLLWWLQAKLSRDLGKPFSELTKPEASIVLPMELADLTSVLPGPSAVLGILISALDTAANGKTETTVAAAINATARNWRESRVESKSEPNLGNLCPILFAMTRSLDTDGEADWLPVYRKQCEVRIDEVEVPRDIALQVYRERLFSKSISEMKK